MKVELFSPGNIIYDEKFHEEIVVTPEVLMLMAMAQYSDRFKRMEAKPESILKLGFTERKSPEKDIRMFDSPRAANNFSISWGWSNIHLTGALFFFGGHPIPFRFLDEIQNIYKAMGKEELSVTLNETPKTLFQV